MCGPHKCRGPTSNMSGPMGPNGPFLPVLEQQPRAPRFQALKMQNPNMQQCHATPHGPRNKDLELSVVPPHQPRPNTQLIVPDAHACRAAHSVMRVGPPGPNVGLGGLDPARGPGVQTLARPRGLLARQQ